MHKQPPLQSKIILDYNPAQNCTKLSLNRAIICMKVIIFLSFLLIFQSLKAQQFSDLDPVFEQKQKILGTEYVMMIWKKNDTLVYKKEAGGFTGKTLAPIASCSKWLTAALVMMFVEEGKLALDDKITNWL